MILFDTESYSEPRLSKFEGRKTELIPSQGTYKSFEKAKKIVVKNIKDRIKDLQEELKEVEMIKSPEDIDFVENPYTGYLRAKHGDLD